jgi:peptidoglycan hydrolase-like protein with peptidoglycan-binding domain
MMDKKHKVLSAFLFGGILGLAIAPAFSQDVPGERRQPDKQLTRPGDNENIPGMRGQGTPELSKQDMMRVEQALQSKGFNPGQVDGVADDATRAAIRSFQKDNGLPITGTIDQRTGEKLGITMATPKRASDQSRQEDSPRSQGRDSDQNVPRDTRK